MRKETITSTTTVQKWGNGLGILIPKAQAAALGLNRGSKVELSLDSEGGELRITPIKSYRIEDLLAAYSGPRPEEYDWGVPMGRELW